MTYRVPFRTPIAGTFVCYAISSPAPLQPRRASAASSRPSRRDRSGPRSRENFLSTRLETRGRPRDVWLPNETGAHGGELEGKKAGPEIEAARASAVAPIKETVRAPLAAVASAPPPSQVTSPMLSD